MQILNLMFFDFRVLRSVLRVTVQYRIISIWFIHYVFLLFTSLLWCLEYLHILINSDHLKAPKCDHQIKICFRFGFFLIIMTFPFFVSQILSFELIEKFDNHLKIIWMPQFNKLIIFCALWNGMRSLRKQTLWHIIYNMVAFRERILCARVPFLIIMRLIASCLDLLHFSLIALMWFFIKCLM